jgi:hypothetical protein
MKRYLLVVLSVVALALTQVGVHAQGRATSAAGTVKSVSGNSLVITAKGGKEMTFMLDNNTKFVGKGLGTKSKAGNMTATDAVAAGDRVSVTYHEMGTMMHAASVRVTAKGGATKSK